MMRAASSAAAAVPSPRRSGRKVAKKAAEATEIKQEPAATPVRDRPKRRPDSLSPIASGRKRVKSEPVSPPDGLTHSQRSAKGTGAGRGKIGAESASPNKARSTIKTDAERALELQSKKLKSYGQFVDKSPFPDFVHPTPAECKLAHRILAQLHGTRVRPGKGKVKAPTNRAGCGNSPSVLDALVRTILSQNTNGRNSSRAKRNMDDVYGGSDKWDAIVEGGQAKLQKTIESGGLSMVKSKVIISVLLQCYEKYGKYSLDHLFEATDEDAMKEMLSFHGVGPKTASCVLLFCLQREDFAVDTHVHRITGLLGWRPKDCNREQTYSHLNAMIPDEDKYGLHILLINHGKTCAECKASGKNVGKCELRKAFKEAKIEGQPGHHVQMDEPARVKDEDLETKLDVAIEHAVGGTV